jgi:hypothetical protein
VEKARDAHRHDRRRDVHDAPAVAERVERVFRCEERPLRVHREDGVPLFGGDLVEPLLVRDERRVVRRVVDEDVQVEPLEQRSHRVLVGDVGLAELGAAAGRLDASDRLAPVCDVRHDDVVPVRREPLCDRRSDAGRRACHHGCVLSVHLLCGGLS